MELLLFTIPITLQLLPICTRRNTDTADPTRNIVLRDTEDANAIISKTLIELPPWSFPNTLVELPMRWKQRTLTEEAK
jgi:hypothetical protein